MSTVPSVSAELAWPGQLFEHDLLFRVSEGFRHVFGHVDVETGVFASMQVSKPRLVGGHSYRDRRPLRRAFGHHGNRCAARAGAGRK